MSDPLRELTGKADALRKIFETPVPLDPELRRAFSVSLDHTIESLKKLRADLDLDFNKQSDMMSVDAEIKAFLDPHNYSFAGYLREMGSLPRGCMDAEEYVRKVRVLRECLTISMDKTKECESRLQFALMDGKVLILSFQYNQICN